MQRREGAPVFFLSFQATLRRLCPIVSIVLLYAVWLVGLTGCVSHQGVSEEMQRHALELVDRGTLLLRERRFGDAQAAFETAYELAGLPAAVDGQGCTAFHQGDLIGAERLFRQAFSMDGNYGEALANLGLVLAVQGRKDEAAAAYRSYLVQRPEAAHVRNNLMILEYERGEATMRVESELRKAAMLTNYGVIADNLGAMRNALSRSRATRSQEEVGRR
jgi:Flp pilus assembly protein TadD